MRRTFLAGSLAAIGALALGTKSGAQSSAAAAPGLVRIKMTTAKGAIVLDLEAEKAPLTTKNFLRYVDLKKLDATNFYRAMPNGEGRGLIQGGDSRRALPPIAHEPTSQTGLSHTEGTISMVRGAPGTARGDFFIVVGDMSGLDAGKVTPDDPGFAAFGHVVEGMDVVKAILASPVSPTDGEGAMKGQMLSPRVPIVTTKRV
jgi:peptidyl-prolyl cis-trans isomerase A (cyclophilin A)